MLSFLGVGLGWLLAAVSIRSVSGASSHRMGLDAVLLEPDLSERVASERFSKVHCWSCEATAVSAIIFLVSRKQFSSGGLGRPGNIIITESGAVTAAA
jgi:hypothetical protein